MNASLFTRDKHRIQPHNRGDKNANWVLSQRVGWEASVFTDAETVTAVFGIEVLGYPSLSPNLGGSAKCAPGLGTVRGIN
jgi:hypothetical protein